MMNLTPLIEKFVLHFGEMGSRWGVNRTVSQIYAILYLTNEPLNANQIVDALGVSRSNVSVGLKELMGMNLVMLKHRADDRKDYYSTHEDIWDIVRNLIEERRKREVEPTLTVLRNLILDKPINEHEKHAQEKIHEMHEVIEMLTGWYNDMKSIDTERLLTMFKLGAKINGLYALKDKLTLKKSQKEECL